MKDGELVPAESTEKSDRPIHVILVCRCISPLHGIDSPSPSDR